MNVPMVAMDERVLPWLDIAEGELADVPGDRGGVTYAGLTAPALAGVKHQDGSLVFDFDKDGDVDSADIRALALMEKGQRTALVSQYYQNLWIGSGAYRLPWPASLLYFDAAVNSGPRVGAVLIQRALGRAQSLTVTPDGIVGKDTALAAKLASPKTLLDAYTRQRMEFFVGICNSRRDQVKFLHGWIDRLRLLALCVESTRRPETVSP